jgi:peptidoglycan/xylan/chitin deacetylase (PgdA/CDA1 family)
MILMYHHVCPLERIPRDTIPLEGWEFNHTPKQFEYQLGRVLELGYTFVSLADYVDQLVKLQRDDALYAAVTFDDGWVDNFEYALPILNRLKIPATFFVVAGEMQGIDRARRMTDGQLRELESQDMSVGGHSMTHPNLAMLSGKQLEQELMVCRESLQQRLERAIDFFAYPGGRFNRSVIECCQQAGYRGACSTIGWGNNTAQSRYYLFRDVLSPTTSTIADRLKLSRVGRCMLQWRAISRLKAIR